ncbi:MAG: hypothetical protein ACKVOR_14605 [Flavobacteriales bacterium]
MDFLERTIEYLSAEEQGEFRLFLIGQRESRKDLKLFDILATGHDHKPAEMVKALGTTNLNAYHTLRKRLMKGLYEFMVLRQLQADATRASSVTGFVSMSQFMLQKNVADVAAYFIKKAETTATQNKQYDLLDTIYHLQIAYADKLQTNLDEAIGKWQQNTVRYQTQQRLSIAYSLIKQQLAEARKQGTMLDVEEVTATVFRDFKLTTEDANTPEFMYKIASMARSAVVSAKDYHRFEPFVVRIYSRLKKAGLFTRNDAEFEMGFIYMLAHVYYRNKKFDAALEQIAELEKVILQKDHRLSELYSKYIALKAAITCFNGDNEASIVILNNALNDKTLRISSTERLNMELNLAVYYFQSSEYKKANKTLLDIAHTDRWLEEKMGKEWRFKKNMIEVIVQIELGHEDIALSKITSIEKHFAQFFKQPAYARAKFFLTFIKKIINDPQIVTTKAFAEQVKAARLALPGEREDLQAITFFAWLKSKMLKRNYYQTLVEVIRTGDFGAEG